MRFHNWIKQEKEDLGITDNLIRYSIGFDDDINNIISDLDKALKLSSKKNSAMAKDACCISC